MSTETKYNGWTNYETWNMKLWMDNDQGFSNYWSERAQEIYRDAEAERFFTKRERAALILGDAIKDEMSDHAQDALEAAKVECSWIADFLNAAVSEVNYHEIAVSLLSDVEDERDGRSHKLTPRERDKMKTEADQLHTLVCTQEQSEDLARPQFSSFSVVDAIRGNKASDCGGWTAGVTQRVRTGLNVYPVRIASFYAIDKYGAEALATVFARAMNSEMSKQT